MAKVVTPLTNTQIKQAKPKNKEYKLGDGDGLQLRIRTNGKKFWIFNYQRPITKKRTVISFGEYPSVSLANARKLRTEAKELLAKNIDPGTDKREKASLAKEASENTLAVWTYRWKELKGQQVKPNTINKAFNSVNRYILSDIGDMPIGAIRVKHVKPLLDPIVSQNKRETVKRLCMFLNEIMRLAVAAGVVDLNPLADLTKLFPSAQKQHQLTISPERLPELMQKIGLANISITTRCMFELQLHTMTRPIEAATAKWEDFDLNKKIWVIPPERMKMKKPHIIPLSDQVLDLLAKIKGVHPKRPYLFPSAKNTKSHANSQTVNMMLKRNGFAGQLVSHGLRAIASTTLNARGFDRDVIEAALAHVDKDEVRRAYNRTDYLDKRRELMAWWSNHINQASYVSVAINQSS